MEVIRIPQVSLVDATGRRIGVYTDDPDWWQQLKLKHHGQNTLLALGAPPLLPPPPPPLVPIQAATLERAGSSSSLTQRQKTSVNFTMTTSRDGSTTNMHDKLIRTAADNNKNNNSSSSKKSSTTDQATERTLAAAATSLQRASSVKPRKSLFEKALEEKECNVIGETPLHIAIMYDDFSTIKFLIEHKGCDVNQRSSGGKFSSGFNSRLTSGLIQQSKYEGLAYYGEYPLAFAACFANKEIYDYLIEKGADPNLQDTNGNTVLHVLVINNKLDMFQYATNHQMKKASHIIKNNQDLTPINLAAKLGRKALFEKMLELRNIEFWRYSNITCSAYPLEGLDTVDADGKIPWNAALSYIVNGETEDHLDMLEIGVVKRLLEDKWSTYAQRRFFNKLIISVVHLILLSIAVYTRASDSTNLYITPQNATTVVRYIAEAGVVLGCIGILFLQAQEIYTNGFVYYLKNLKGEPANVFYQIFCIFILIAVPFRFIEFSHSSQVTPRNVEDTLVILAIPCGWVHLLFYARVATVTGPFVVMIYKMIIGDILTFSAIYVLLLFGFSLGFYYLYKNIGDEVQTMVNYPEALMISFQMTLGEFKARLPEFDKIYYSDFTKVVFVVFMILMHILLLNMLIAMMGNTYHQIIKKSEKEWRRQWAHIVLLLERSFSPQELKKFQNQYCIKLPSKNPLNANEVGLMVIKKVPKTKAFQKIACIRNWKKFNKSIMKLLKEHNCNAVQLLDIWENKDITVTKVKKAKKEFDWSQYDRKVEKKTSTAHVKAKAEPVVMQPAVAEQRDKLKEKEREAEKAKETKTPSSKVADAKPAPHTSSKTVKSEPLEPVVAAAPAPTKATKSEPPAGGQNVTQTGGVTALVSSSSKEEQKKAETNATAPPPLAQDDTVKLIDSKTTSATISDESDASSRADSALNYDPASTMTLVRFTHKKTFYPNQTRRIYPMTSSSISGIVPSSTTAAPSSIDYYENPPPRVKISPLRDATQLDLGDLKRPLSSALKTSDYMKQDTYPKFPMQSYLAAASTSAAAATATSTATATADDNKADTSGAETTLENKSDLLAKDKEDKY